MNEALARILKEVKEHFNKDKVFELDTLDEKLLKIPAIKGYYHGVISKLLPTRAKLERKLAKLKKQKFEYYITDYDLKIDRRDVQIFLDGDLELQSVQENLDDVNLIIRVCEDCLRSIDNMTYHAGNAIKWAIYKGGG